MSDLAQKFYDEISRQGLKRSEAVGVVSELLTKLIQGSTTGPVTPTAPPTPPPLRSPSVPYDPLYDPAPPFEPERPPPRDEGIGDKILAPQNTACICAACKKVVYVTNTAIRDKMKVSEFIAAYSPTPGMPNIPKTTEIQNIDGNITMDCPACAALKQLYLTGGPVV